MKKTKGFTLIELMVVVAIIGILAAVIVTTVNSARARGRDAKRTRDIQEINTAIQLYVLTNGYPPNFGSASCANVNNYDPSCFGSSTNGLANWNILATELEPFLKILPSDPCPTCVATNTLILNAYAAQGDLEYVYHAPAAVNAYLVDNGLNPVTAGINEQPYSVFSTKLEGKNTPFGFGLSTASVITVADEDVVVCPYIGDDEKCAYWEQCNAGEERACRYLDVNTSDEIDTAGHTVEVDVGAEDTIKP